MANITIDFNSFSPFWIHVNTAGIIIDLSDYFKKETAFIGKSIFEAFKFNRLYIKQDQTISNIFNNKIVDFEFSAKAVAFRGTFHSLGDGALIVVWPKLRDIAEIKQYNLTKEMSHPACILTDLLITKDLLGKSQAKINQIEIKKIENQLSLIQERNKTILGKMVEGVVVFNVVGKIIEHNAAFLKVFELNLKDFLEDQIVNTTLSILDHHNRLYKLASLFDVCKDAPFYGREFSLVNPNKSLKYLSVNCSKIDIGEEFFFILTANDITEKIESEKQLNAQKELSQQNAKLASIGELAAGVGHEINNPLAIISGQLELIKKDISNVSSNPKIDERFTKISKSIQRISNITKGLRTFARADNVENLYFDFSELLQETINMLQEIFAKEGVEIKTHIEREIFTFANYGRIQQVIVNLLNNAKDAVAQSQEKVINVNLSKLDQKINLSIHDTGCGIPNEIQRKIFEPFFTTKEVSKGTGIGLALVNSIVKEHLGEITVTSKIGEGAHFKIILPIIQNEQNTVINKPEKNRAKYPNGKQLIKDQNSAILLVDDEEDIRDILVEMLSLYPYQVIQAASVEQALELFETNKASIKLILTDLTMPKKNGLQLIEELKSQHNYQGKSYIVTGGSNLDIEMIEDVVDGVVLKPFDDQAIQEIIYSTFQSN
jgi:PAS domain S-box-containing protein